MQNIFSNLPKPFLCLAPMEAVTDLVFRQVITKSSRPDIFYTEFTNVDSYNSLAGRHNALDRVKFLPSEQPIIAQIWGSNPEYFESFATQLKDLGYLAVDINMGCPDSAVIRIASGSGLIRNPELANQIITATKKSGLPVTVKTRLGYSRIEEYQDWLTNLLQQDLAALTIHLRTKKEMSKVPAHYELIPEIIKLRDKINPQTKIIINGDIRDAAHARELQQQYGFDGAMIGRGVFANPFCFGNHQPTRAELIELLNLHLDLFDKTNIDGRQKFDPLKRFFKIYIHDFDGSKELRAKLMLAKTTAEVRDLMIEFNHAS